MSRSLDKKIINGTIIDGTGRQRYQGDIGIKDGVIVEVGDSKSTASDTIDADGAIVTPGFTDVHTHYDGQISWDSEMAPSSVHGVTTAVMGSCGVGFAPVHDTDHDLLIRLMEGVEDIPGTALTEGLTWNWRSFPEYMDAIDNVGHTIDFCAQVPHDALRVYVMGERGAAGEDASDEDIAKMRALVAEALDQGAAGFSTGRTDGHRTADGKETPASVAATRELTGIASAFVGKNHGVLQAVSDFDLERDQSQERFDAEFDVLEEMLKASGGHPMSLSLLQRDLAPGQWRQIMHRAELAAKAGNAIRLQVASRAIGVMLGFQATFHPFLGLPSYREIAHLPLDERVRRLKDPAMRAKLLSEKPVKVSGSDATPPLVDYFLNHLDLVTHRVYPLGEDPNYEPSPETSVAARAQALGKPVLEVLYDDLLEDNGRALLYFPVYNYLERNLDAVHEMLTHPLALCGLSDGGAHVGTVCDASMPTFLLSHWGRDRAKDRLPLEKLVKMQTHDTSRYIGLQDRGTIEVGMRADINVIDFDKLRLKKPEMRTDLPGGSRRLMQDADGYRATMVKGTVIAANGKLTGEEPGRLVRVGRA